jgi:hypothetical protein
MTGAIAEMRIAPYQPAGDRSGVGIDQQLVRIEAKSALGLVEPVHPVTVELPRPDVGKISVPHILGALRQCDARLLAPAVAVEQAQLDLLGIGGEQCEIGTPAIPRGAEPVWRPGGHALVRSQPGELPCEKGGQG